MSLSRPLLAVPAALAAALLFAGCTSPATGGSSTDESSGTAPQSPLSVYMDAMYGGGGSPDDQQARLAAQQKKREEIVATCMKEKGFEYTPDLQSAVSTLAGGGDEWKPDDREWVSQWGYGAADFPGNDDSGNSSTTWVDPNADYLESLTESERTAFTEALWGKGATDASTEATSGEASEWDWTTAGCQGAAYHEVNGQDPLQTDEFAPLMDAINELWQQASTAPGMPETDRDWATCMDETGYPGFTAQSDAPQSIHAEVNELWKESGDDSAGKPVKPDATKLAEVKEREITLALADLDCREKTDYAERAKKARWDAEAAFVADHKSELEALKVAAAQAQP